MKDITRLNKVQRKAVKRYVRDIFRAEKNGSVIVLNTREDIIKILQKKY
ncbi:RNase P protein component [Elusimicrobium simillimum]